MGSEVEEDKAHVNVSLVGVDTEHCVYFYGFDPADIEPVFTGGGVGLGYAYARWNEMDEFERVEGKGGVPEASSMCDLLCVRCDISGAKTALGEVERRVKGWGFDQDLSSTNKQTDVREGSGGTRYCFGIAAKPERRSSFVPVDEY